MTNLKQLFPQKKDILRKGVKGKQVQLVSNHFPIKMPNNLYFVEWHSRILLKTEMQKYLDNRDYNNEAIPYDARFRRD